MDYRRKKIKNTMSRKELILDRKVRNLHRTVIKIERDEGRTREEISLC